jgi:hypothetical protein
MSQVNHSFFFKFEDGRCGVMEAENLLQAFSILLSAVRPYYPEGLVEVRCPSTSIVVRGKTLEWWRTFVTQSWSHLNNDALEHADGDFYIYATHEGGGVLDFSRIA